jgi:hypothetical protein
MAIEITMKHTTATKIYTLQRVTKSNPSCRQHWNSKKWLYEIGNRIPVGISKRSCDNRNVKKSPPKKPEQLLSTLLVHLFLELDLR